MMKMKHEYFYLRCISLFLAVILTFSFFTQTTFFVNATNENLSESENIPEDEIPGENGTPGFRLPFTDPKFTVNTEAEWEFAVAIFKEAMKIQNKDKKWNASYFHDQVQKDIRPLAKLNGHIKITNTSKQRKAEGKTPSSIAVSF